MPAFCLDFAVWISVFELSLERGRGIGGRASRRCPAIPSPVPQLTLHSSPRSRCIGQIALLDSVRGIRPQYNSGREDPSATPLSEALPDERGSGAPNCRRRTAQQQIAGNKQPSK
jgi:hypothetical protein